MQRASRMRSQRFKDLCWFVLFIAHGFVFGKLIIPYQKGALHTQWYENFLLNNFLKIFSSQLFDYKAQVTISLTRIPEFFSWLSIDCQFSEFFMSPVGQTTGMIQNHPCSN